MKKLLWIGIGAVAMIAASVSGNGSVPQTAPAPAPIVHISSTPQPTPVVQDQQFKATPQLSNDNYYTNTRGNTVHSPAYTNDNSIPAGASARCRDGTYSFSQSRRGTCSHHGGVSSWL